MRFEEVHRAFKRQPFQPLLVRMVSGSEYRIRTPESIVSPRFAAFLLPDGTIETVALEYIEAIRPLGSDGRVRGKTPRR